MADRFKEYITSTVSQSFNDQCLNYLDEVFEKKPGKLYSNQYKKSECPFHEFNVSNCVALHWSNRIKQNPDTLKVGTLTFLYFNESYLKMMQDASLILTLF